MILHLLLIGGDFLHHVFVFNPHAGKVSREKDLRNKAEARLAGEVVFHVTTDPEDTTRFVRSFCERHPGEPTRFYACGGDGTLSGVVNGAVGFDKVTVYPYPCGSGNDFVKYYGKAEDFLALPEATVDIPVDLMRVGDRYAINVVNFGFDTEVCRTMETVRKKPLIGGRNAYYTGVIRALFTAMKNLFTVTVDGELLNDGTMLLCTVACGRYIGGSFCCAPRSDNTDGLLEVCLAKPISRFKFVKLIRVYTEGRHLDDPRFSDIIRYRRGRRIEVMAPDGFACCLDGEIVDRSRFTVEVIPGGITLCIPASLAEAKEPVATATATSSV